MMINANFKLLFKNLFVLFRKVSSYMESERAYIQISLLNDLEKKNIDYKSDLINLFIAKQYKKSVEKKT